MAHSSRAQLVYDDVVDVQDVDGQVYQEYPDFADWEGEIAHEVTVDDEGEYIEVDALDDVAEQYIDHGHDGYGDPENMQFHQHLDALAGVTSMNCTIKPPEVLSRMMHFPGGGYMILCFNKNCQSQIAFEGYLYTLVGSLNPMAYNIWRCVNPGCPGAMRTSPNFSALKMRQEHYTDCMPDDIQIRVRIATYDILLCSEFSSDNTPLEELYTYFVEKLMKEQPDIVRSFPSYENLRLSMVHHNSQWGQTFRKRFEARKQLAQRRREGLVIEKSKFKRTKAFPPSICVECNQEFPSGDLAPSQDLLIQHLTYNHERPLVIERYTFHEPSLFENWLRELSAHSRYRLRKVGLYDEHMYYLCCADDRQQRCNHTRGSILHMQCPAFIRVHDWRYILRREMNHVIVDYCLDHCFHSGDSPLPEAYRQPLFDYYSPEVFMKEIEHKQKRSAKIATSIVSGGNKFPRNESVYNEQGGEVYLVDQNYPEQLGDYPMEEELAPVDQQWLGEEIYDAAPVEPVVDTGRVTFQLKKDSSMMANVGNPGTNHITVRQNFDDRETFASVTQLEIQCDQLKQRMQHCRRPDVARRYLQRINGILEDIMADPHCSPKSNGQAIAEKPLPMDTEDMPGPSSRTTIIKNGAKQQVVSPIGLQAKKEIKMQQLAQGEGNGQPVRQAMFLKRGENGKMTVVKRVIRKVKKTVEIVPGDESAVQPAQNEPRLGEEDADVNVVDDIAEEEGKADELHEDTLGEPTPKRSQRMRRPPVRQRF